MNNTENLKKLEVDDTHYETKFTTKYLNRKPYQRKDPKVITAFIPGVIKAVFVQPGHSVKQGDKLLLLEAMKMENKVSAPINGKIKQIHVKVNERVSKGQLLLELE